MPPVSVLIKPASSRCNLNCTYCFYHDVADNRSVADYGLMSLETIEAIIQKVLHFASDYATFSFQGGEPTLRGLDFFKSVVRLQEKHNVHNASITNCLQTNGILIDGEWAAFLRDKHFLVGLSLDGPDRIHDEYRISTGGKGTFKKVMQTVELFNKCCVEYNILFTITGLTAAHPDKLYEFFKAGDFNFLQFMPCIDPLDGERGLHEYSLTPKQYAFFLKRFFDKWYADFMGGREISVRYYDNLVRMVMGTVPEMCSLRGSCQCQFVFEADGSVYPCDFYVADEWKLGSIYDNDILGLYESDTCQRFIESSRSAAAECLQCKWKSFCRGGCRRDREIGRSGEMTRNYFCESYNGFLEYAYPCLLDVARYVQAYHTRAKKAGTVSQP